MRGVSQRRNAGALRTTFYTLGEASMTTETNSSPENGDGQKKKRTLLLALLLLLLLATAVAVYVLVFMKDDEPQAATFGDNGEFRTSFEGCDDAGLCAKFTIYAPGLAYSWQYDRAVPAPLPAGKEPFGALIAEDIKTSDAILVAGLSSQEGPQSFNERLATCRARAFEGIMVDAREQVGASTEIFRVALGRYNGPDAGAATASVAADAPAGAGTRLQRIMVVAFISEEPTGLARAEALRNGARAHLGDALREALGANEEGNAAAEAVAQQLDFQRYSCWGDFEVVALGGYAKACYVENPSFIDAYCAAFN